MRKYKDGVVEFTLNYIRLHPDITLSELRKKPDNFRATHLTCLYDLIKEGKIEKGQNAKYDRTFRVKE